MNGMKAVELAVVVRVGDRRVPVIVASISDQEMLRATLRRAIAAATMQAGEGTGQANGTGVRRFVM